MESFPAACWSCGKSIDGQDSYCRFCGNGQGSFIPWYYHPLGLAALTFFAMGPLVLPLVWRSPRLSRQGKGIATVLVGAFTLWLFYQLMEMMNALQAALGGALPSGG